MKEALQRNSACGQLIITASAWPMKMTNVAAQSLTMKAKQYCVSIQPISNVEPAAALKASKLNKAQPNVSQYKQLESHVAA